MLQMSPALQAQMPRICAVDHLTNLLAEHGLDKDDFVVRYPHSAMFCDRRYAFEADPKTVHLSCALTRRDFVLKYNVTPSFLKSKGIEIGFSEKPVPYIVKEDFKVESPAEQKISHLLFDLFADKEMHS